MFHRSFYMMAPQPGVVGRVYTVRGYELDGVQEVELHGEFAPEWEANRTGEHRVWDGSAWRRQLDADYPDADVHIDGTGGTGGGPFLWTGELDPTLNWYGRSLCMLHIQGDRPMVAFGYDGVDRNHVYFCSWGGTPVSSDILVMFRFDIEHPITGEFGVGYEILEGGSFFFKEIDADLDPPDSYNIPGFLTYSKTEECFFVTGSSGWLYESSNFYEKAVIARVTPSGLADGDENVQYPMSTVIEYRSDEYPVNTLYGGTSVRELGDGTIMACFSGSGGTEPLLMKRTAGSWSEFTTQPPHAGYAAHRVTYFDVHGVSVTDFWVCGQKWIGPGEVYAGLLLHWNGVSWTDYSQLGGWDVDYFFYVNPGFPQFDRNTPLFRVDDGLHSLYAFASDDVWVVGTYNSSHFIFDTINWVFFNQEPFTAHWDGAGWSIYPVEE